MEVHHHTPHLGHEKNWKEYFYEFLMLFLAVSAGFIAENIREHTVEKKRAEELAQSVYNDIKKDTASLHVVMKFTTEKKARLDSAIAILHTPEEKWNDTALYKNIVMVIRVNTFERSAGTYQQLINSGSLRYFDQHLVDLLNNYDVYAKKLKEREDIETKSITEQILPFMMKIFNMESAYDIMTNLPVTHSLYFKIRDPDHIDQLINYASMAKRGRDRWTTEYKNLMAVANDALDELKKEYDLE